MLLWSGSVRRTGRAANTATILSRGEIALRVRLTRCYLGIQVVPARLMCAIIDNYNVYKMTYAPARHHVESFPPQVGAGSALLILGTVPSVRSLELGQSYGHRHNLFWPFMGEMFGAGPEWPYPERIARLKRRGIGIWDVLECCERRGSLDSAIVAGSEVANDIPQLLDLQPTISAIALNGGKARQAFRRHVLPRLSADMRARVTLLDLPSTSPANASIPRAIKRERWQVIADWLADGARA